MRITSHTTTTAKISGIACEPHLDIIRSIVDAANCTMVSTDNLTKAVVTGDISKFIDEWNKD